MTKFLCCILTALALTGACLAPASAQGRLTSAQLEELRAKVEFQRDSYHRYDTAEQEAMAQGSPERAAVFHQAKQKAYDAYVGLNAEYQKAQMERREQQRRDAAQKPPER
ncbi:hypothetical protein NNJEOMEG_01360 [Fundidesulfovibrio magnetotacticus]|uniref:DUF4398 domain-containing protein n=1 Tax=Fundidesulfovibrio magnetotacticus TaxID=2730080 RepID=A0A6V8LUN5_9BACT|nr:hypothetical protein [Fundidesulfovibrio magnetotacticus]GFK93526.1 hypothetical protein NNJEOMEG_01360 [Fundidesulfovibrio magnetotacticus]